MKKKLRGMMPVSRAAHRKFPAWNGIWSKYPDPAERTRKYVDEFCRINFLKREES